MELWSWLEDGAVCRNDDAISEVSVGSIRSDKMMLGWTPRVSSPELTMAGVTLLSPDNAIKVIQLHMI